MYTHNEINKYTAHSPAHPAVVLHDRAHPDHGASLRDVYAADRGQR